MLRTNTLHTPGYVALLPLFPRRALDSTLTSRQNAAAQGRAAIANALGQYRPVNMNMNMMQPTGLPNGVGPSDLKRAAMTNRAPYVGSLLSFSFLPS